MRGYIRGSATGTGNNGNRQPTQQVFNHRRPLKSNKNKTKKLVHKGRSGGTSRAHLQELKPSKVAFEIPFLRRNSFPKALLQCARGGCTLQVAQSGMGLLS